jgi:gamma-glutamyltranspeptidase / glutathione hydrolase
MNSAGRSEVQGEFGVVSATDRFAASAGMAILENGGNAFDAVVAAAFVMQVVEPHLSGPAGEVSGVFFARSDGYPRVLCGQGPAPAGATPEHFADVGLSVVPGTGVLSAPVPGAFDAWMLLLRDYGTKSLREVFDAAIGYAEAGHPLLFIANRHIGRLESVFREHWPTSAAVFLPGGKVPSVSQTFRNPGLAATYRRILTEAEAAGGGRERQIDAARRAWYQGFVAEEIERFADAAHGDPTFGTLRGVITAADLCRYEASFEKPVTLDWREWTICKPAAWTQGPVFLQQLALLDGFDNLRHSAESAEYVHVTSEVAKLAYADREVYYGDVPGVPLAELLARDYADQRRKLISECASWHMRPGSPCGRDPRLPALVPRSPEDVPRVEEAIRRATRDRLPAASGDTCHVAAADRWGNVVATTPSGGFLMNSPVIDSLGFPLSTRLEMTWLEGGLPNTLTAGRRPRTTLSPTLALRDGQPALGFGTPGADQQEQWSLLFFLAVNSGLDLQSAMDGTRWHTNHLASSLYPHQTILGQIEIEGSAPEPVIAELRRRGHEVIVRKPASLGRLCAVGRDPATGRLFAAADSRFGQAHACGH